MLVGFYNSGLGIGDKVQFGSIPENFYRTLGHKLIDLQKCWVFDYNPYVLRDVAPVDGTIDLWHLTLTGEARLSQQDRFNESLGIKTYVRHPRLYRFENDPIIPKTVVVHTNGKSEGGEMQDQVIEQIAKTYKDYIIYQIGGHEDRPTPFEQRRGLSMWSSAQLIATSEIFIGVNSSMMNIANCYPRVRRKVLINNKELTKYYPVSHYGHWIDYNWEYFNPSDDDIGITMSYRKI